MSNITSTPVTFVLLYLTLIVLYVIEAAHAIKNIIMLSRVNVTPYTKMIYNYLYAVVVSLIAMAFRMTLNIMACDGTEISIIRVISNVMILYVVFMANRIIWKACICDNYRHVLYHGREENYGCGKNSGAKNII